MSALTDKASDFWARISPRERRLVLIAAVAVPLTIAIWLGLAIHDGLDAMAGRTQKTRKALDALADLRARGQTHEQVDDVVATMGTEPLSLDTYLSNAAKKAKFELKSTITPRQPVTRNGYVTNTSTLTLDNLTIDQLRDFLQEIESGSKVVAVTHLDMRRDFRDKDKIDVNLEVSTYSKEKPAQPEGSAAAAEKKGS
ncbi:MAG: type II secretion system protein M [Deltaproteobacteria bacterium]|nr:type II secretion system protein M [Deltaproteobacteria bacterium]